MRTGFALNLLFSLAEHRGCERTTCEQPKHHCLCAGLQGAEARTAHLHYGCCPGWQAQSNCANTLFFFLHVHSQRLASILICKMLFCNSSSCMQRKLCWLLVPCKLLTGPLQLVPQEGSSVCPQMGTVRSPRLWWGGSTGGLHFPLGKGTDVRRRKGKQLGAL